MRHNKIFNLIKKGDLEAVKQLFESVDVQSTSTDTFLHSITFNPHAVNHNQDNILDFAILQGKTKIIEYLLQYNYEVTNRSVEYASAKILKLLQTSNNLRIKVVALLQYASTHKRADLIDFVRVLRYPLDFRDATGTALSSLIKDYHFYAKAQSESVLERETKRIHFLLSFYSVEELKRYKHIEFADYVYALREKKIMSEVQPVGMPKSKFKL